jgi:CheY-like chemotaxis protein
VRQEPEGRERMSSKKILIIDDDVLFASELSTTLELSGYDVALVNDGSQALAAATSRVPDIILLDLKLKDLTGFQVAMQLKKDPLTKRIPIVAMTGYFNKKDHLSLLYSCGFEDYLYKPFNPLDVIARIEGYREDRRIAND